MTPTNESESELDLATARRLRRLADAPVDLAALQARLAVDIPRPAELAKRRWTPRPWLAAAASVAAIALVSAAVLFFSPRPVLASTEMLEDLYKHNDSMLVDPSVESAMPCCVRQVEGRNVTCMSIDLAGQRVMMTVGDGKQFKVPESAGRKVVDGVEYRHQSSGKINMVMTVRDGAWVCLMGEPSIDELIARLATMGRVR